MMKYDVFVSYRRTSFDSANLIATRLKAAGYRVFFDLEAMRSGPFNEQLYSVIEDCEDFVLVLAPEALDRCINEDDWVRKEILHAMEHGKNIIPIMLNGFEWPDPMPAGIEKLKMYQAVTSSKDFFDLAMKRLESYLKSRKMTKSRVMARWGLGIITALFVIILSSVLLLRSVSTPTCKYLVSHLTARVSAVDILLSDIAYLEDLTEGIEKKSISEVESSVDFVIKDVDSVKKTYTGSIKEITSMQKMQLIAFGVSPFDLNGFEDYYHGLYSDIEYIVNLFSVCSESGYLPSEKETLENYLTSFRHSVNVLYFCYLQIINKLPESSLEEYRKSAVKFVNMPKTGIGLPSREYELLIQREFEAFERLNDEISANVSSMADEEFILQSELDSIKLKELNAYKVYIAKSAIDPKMEPDQNWAKICLVARMLSERVTYYKQDLAEGMDPGHVIPQLVYDDLCEIIDSYVELYPEAEEYSKELKAFYSEVADGHRDLAGVLICSFAPGSTHDAFRVGDIIISYGGTKVLDYQNLNDAYRSQGPEGDVQVLRLSGDGLKLIDIPSPGNYDIVGFKSIR